ncbi:hypothetical protein, partial [Microbispora sp. NPDC049125]|uniref:hypothetical protein n=1 Tax=Microbispora sp. NPDC049125 TaxID=3154929 RepID=UPI003467D497
VTEETRQRLTNVEQTVQDTRTDVTALGTRLTNVEQTVQDTRAGVDHVSGRTDLLSKQIDALSTSQEAMFKAILERLPDRDGRWS